MTKSRKSGRAQSHPLGKQPQGGTACVDRTLAASGDAQGPILVIDGLQCDLTLPLFFLGGPNDPALATSEEGWLFMFSTEENVHQFIEQVTNVVRGFTKVSDASDLLEILQAVRTAGVREVCYDAEHQTSLVWCFWIDELVDFAEDLLREKDSDVNPIRT